MITIAPHIAWNNVEGELALFDSRTGGYHTLNGTAAAIWRAIAAGQDEAGITETLAATYGAPHHVVADEVRGFIEAARGKGLLEGTA